MIRSSQASEAAINSSPVRWAAATTRSVIRRRSGRLGLMSSPSRVLAASYLFNEQAYPTRMFDGDSVVCTA
ncbi:hypothetical protein GCM10007967_27100 [Xylanimonas ulmi]